MNPAPPVTSSLIAAGRLAARLGEARDQAVAPVGEDGRALPFAPKYRVRRPRRGSPELVGRDAAHPALDPRLLEDRLREIGPGAVSVARPDARAPAEGPRLRARAPPRRDGRRRWGTLAGRRRPRPRPAPVRPGASSGRSCGPSVRRARTCARSRRRRRPPLRGASSGHRRRAGSARPTRRTGCACGRRTRSRSRRRRAETPSAATFAVPPTFTAVAPCGSASAPSTSVQAAVCSTRSKSRSRTASPAGYATSQSS